MAKHKPLPIPIHKIGTEKSEKSRPLDIKNTAKPPTATPNQPKRLK